MIQQMTDTGVTVLQGTVTSASPLKIQIANDEKLIIGESITYVPKHLTDYEVKVDITGGGSGNVDSGGSHTHSGGQHNGHTGNSVDSEGNTSSNNGSHTHSGGEHTHSLSDLEFENATMTVHNALEVGDTVHILQFNKGKQYYVLDRV